MPKRPLRLSALRRYAIARSLQSPTTLRKAVRRAGFIQADPIRAPARAQDLILRHRVQDYRVGDLEANYKRLGIDEEYFVNYGFILHQHLRWLHPRLISHDSKSQGLATALLAFVREREEVHPRDADAHFKGGRVKRWSGTSALTTHLLDKLHFGGDLRVVRRENGIRVYCARVQPMSESIELPREQCVDALIDLIVRIYAPLPAASLVYLCRLLSYSAPHLSVELRAAVKDAKRRNRHERAAGTDWFWPDDEDPRRHCDDTQDSVRLLAPFDPIVWDRRRFELCWGWDYKFEAYTPASKRRFGYYALPLLFRDRLIGWGNLTLQNGVLQSEFGYVDGRAPRSRIYARELSAELERIRAFLDTSDHQASAR